MKKTDLRSIKENPKLAREMAAGMDPNAISQVQKVVEQYQGKSETEIMADLKNMVGAERAAGTLTNERMDSIMGMLAPMLDPSQKQRMQAIVQQLKKS